MPRTCKPRVQKLRFLSLSALRYNPNLIWRCKAFPQRRQWTPNRSDSIIIIIIIIVLVVVGIIPLPSTSKRPVLMVARYTAWIGCHSPAEVVSSNSAGDINVFLLWVLSGSSLCDEMMTCPEDCVVVCDLGTSRTRGSCSTLGPSATGELPVNKFNAQWKQISLATSRGAELRPSYR